MSIIFISYADEKMAYSLKRIGRQAKKLGIFDQVILYTPAILPDYIKKSPLMQYSRGGGYWSWKPAIIWETLQKNQDGDIIIYSDAGCSIQPSSEWNTLIDLLKEKSAICFQYKDEMPAWAQFGQTSTKIQFWTKDITLNYFKDLLHDPHYGEKYNKIMGGFIFAKGKNNPFIKHWLDITLHQPELILDPEYDKTTEKNRALAYHKHDQSIITPLAHLYSNEIVILEEKAESNLSSPIVASRVRAKDYKEYLILITKLKLRSIFGENIYNNLKEKIKKLIK